MQPSMCTPRPAIPPKNSRSRTKTKAKCTCVVRVLRSLIPGWGSRASHLVAVSPREVHKTSIGGFTEHWIVGDKACSKTHQWIRLTAYVPVSYTNSTTFPTKTYLTSQIEHVCHKVGLNFQVQRWITIRNGRDKRTNEMKNLLVTIIQLDTICFTFNIHSAV